MKSGTTIIAIAIILSAAMITATVINPKSFTMEASGLMLIAAFLGGIYVELRRLNNTRVKE